MKKYEAAYAVLVIDTLTGFHVPFNSLKIGNKFKLYNPQLVVSENSSRYLYDVALEAPQQENGTWTIECQEIFL